MRLAVLGAGAVGARVVRQLVMSSGVHPVAVADRDRALAGRVADAVGDPVQSRDVGDLSWADGADVAVLAHPGGHHGEVAGRLVAEGVSVVSVSDDLVDVVALLALDAEANRRGVVVAAGAGFAPGLTCLLAGHAAATFDQVDEVHVAKTGTGGPACARGYHQAWRGDSQDWRDGQWVRRTGGSGRELCWFPDPVGSQDCFRAAAADPLVLVPAFPGVGRVTSRVGASRRDRISAHLPMLRRPHREGTLGAIRVEVRGRRAGAHGTVVLGAIDRPAVAAGAVAALVAVALGSGQVRRTAAGGVAELVEDRPAFLAELARRGVKVATFDGASSGLT